MRNRSSKSKLISKSDLEYAIVLAKERESSRLHQKHKPEIQFVSGTYVWHNKYCSARNMSATQSTTGAVPAKFTVRPSNKEYLIAPCGMNCSLCSAYLRLRNPCPGCRRLNSGSAKGCIACRIRLCHAQRVGEGRFCVKCESFPCERIRHMDKRYRTKYGMSIVENLRAIGTGGVRQFVKQERAKWRCPQCGETLCVHKPTCVFCDRPWHKLAL
jgi:hypothetical protein